MLTALLAERFDIAATTIAPQPGGQDDRAAVYRVRDAGGGQWIVKTRAATPRTRAPARTASYLHQSGIPHIVAPLSARDGQPQVEVDGRAVTVYPFVDGRHAAEAGLRAGQWLELGVFVRSLHGARLPPVLRRQLRRDRFRQRELGLVGRVDAAAETRQASGTPAARQVAAFWVAHRREILGLARRTRVLGDRMRALRLPDVVTHGDLHTFNVLVDADDELWVVDWDELILAPRERDLMFFVGGIAIELVGADATAAFLEGYDGPVVDSTALADYRHAWAVQDIAGYAGRVLLRSSLAEARQDEAATIFTGLFRPGEILELAVASLDDLRVPVGT